MSEQDTLDEELLLEEEEVLEPEQSEEVIEEITEPSEKQEVEEEDIQEVEQELSEEESEALLKEEADRRHAFEASLKERFSKLNDKNAACQQSGASNPDLYFNQIILYNKDEEEADRLLKQLEDKDQEIKKEVDASDYLLKRSIAYKEIDVLLLEGLAEKEAGDSSKLELYLEKRQAIKDTHKKPE